jgi:hypothetical protein
MRMKLKLTLFFKDGESWNEPEFLDGPGREAR